LIDEGLRCVFCGFFSDEKMTRVLCLFGHHHLLFEAKKTSAGSKETINAARTKQ